VCLSIGSRTVLVPVRLVDDPFGKVGERLVVYVADLKTAEYRCLGRMFAIRDRSVKVRSVA
jgi:hypothetical protein